MLFWLLLSQGVLRADQIVYDGTLENGWQNWGWAALNFTNSSPVYAGNTHSISVTINSAWAGMQLYHPDQDASPYASLSFWLNGGPNGGQKLQMYGLLHVGTTNNYGTGHYSLGNLPTNTWQQYTVPLSSLGVANQTNFTGFVIQDATGAVQPTFFVDGISLNGNTNNAVANVTINATNVISTVQAGAFGMFMAVWDGWGPGTAAPLKQAGVTALRYPGGSYADIYHWSAYLTSPVDGEDGNYGYLSGSTTMPDFINLLSNAQSLAVISVDWGSGFLWNASKTAMAVPSTNGTPQEAAAWVAYCNAVTNLYGTTNDVQIGTDALGNNWQTAGYWAMLRAASPLVHDDGYNFLRMSHPAPVGVKYWEIGNEPYGNGYYGGEGWENDYALPYPYTNYTRYANALLSPAAYGQSVKAFSIAMKAVDPTIKVGAFSSTPPGDYSWDYLSGVNNGEHWTPQVLAQCGSNIDFLIVHWYPNFSDNLGTNLLSEVGSTIPLMINGTGPYPHTGTNSGLEDWITNYCPNPGQVQIAVTEFGANNYPYLTNNLGTMPILGPVEALFYADCMSTWLTYPAFANADWLDYDGNSFLGSGSNGPVVYAMQMLRHLCNPGDGVVKASSDTSTLRAQTVVRQDGNLGILLINENISRNQTVNLMVSNADLATVGTVYQFGTNNWSGPNQYTNEVPSSGPTSNIVSGLGNQFVVTVPAYTMEVLVIPLKPEAPAFSSEIVNVNGSVTLHVSTSRNFSSRIYAATNLTGSIVWQPIYTNTNGGGDWQFTDTNTSGIQAKYYRLSTP